MSNALDQSLDDIISSKPRNRGIRKGRRGGALRVNKAAAVAARRPAATSSAATAVVTATAGQVAQQNASAIFDQGSKIIVSNLPVDVTEQQIKELFNVQIGKVSRVTLTYGQDGKSKGVATIQFAQKGDAKKAYDRYDGKLIDNSKRLKIEIIMDPRTAKPALAQRIQQIPIVSIAAPRAPRGSSRGGLRGRGTRGSRGAGRSASTRHRPKKTVEELDAEMTDYYSGAVAGNTTAAAGT